MPFVRCPQCRRNCAVADELLGRRVRCTACQAVFPTQAPTSFSRGSILMAAAGGAALLAALVILAIVLLRSGAAGVAGQGGTVYQESRGSLQGFVYVLKCDTRTGRS